jgi:cation transport regulator ChaB/tetrahydromethanopterin S-methyltransferase subunit G
LRELIEARLNGNDHGISLLRATVDTFPDKTSAAVAALQELHEEKFNSIGIQFKERDVRTDQTSRDSKVAVDAALKAQQEAFAEQNKSSALAISKSEAATTKQIDLIGGNITALSKSIDDKFNDIKERVTSIEARTQGASIQKSETVQSTSQNWAYIVGSLGAVIGFASLVVSIIIIVVGRH